MSAGWGVLIVTAYMTLALTVTRAWARHAIKAIARRDRADAQRAQRIEDIETLPTIPAAPDNTEGINRGDWDDCELIWAAPFDPQTGLDRLRREIQQQKEGEQ